MHDYADRRIQEIVAKTVIARGRRQIEQRCVLKPAERPEKLLGVTCVPGAIQAKNKSGHVTASGNFEIHIWYAHSGSQHTTVLKQTFTYEELVPVTQLVGEPVGEPTVEVALSQSPQVTACQIGADGRFHVDVTLEVQAQLTGDARLRVQVFFPPTAALADEDAEADDAFVADGNSAHGNDFVAESDFLAEDEFMADDEFLPNGNVTHVMESNSADFD